VSITTTSLLSAPVQQSFSFKLLSVPVPYMIHKIPAELKSMPRNGGTTLRMRRYNPLAPAMVPLGNSGVNPPPQVLSSVNIDATMSFYGSYILLNEQVTLQSQDPVLNESAARLSVCLRQTEDQLMRDELVASSAMINATSGSDGDVPTEITRQDIDLVVRTLRNNMAYSFLSGVEGENRFGTAPRIACGGFKPLVIDLEALAA
jgi:N4-gp56 family major capsid protein